MYGIDKERVSYADISDLTWLAGRMVGWEKELHLQYGMNAKQCYYVFGQIFTNNFHNQFGSIPLNFAFPIKNDNYCIIKLHWLYGNILLNNLDFFRISVLCLFYILWIKWNEAG